MDDTVIGMLLEQENLIYPAKHRNSLYFFSGTIIEIPCCIHTELGHLLFKKRSHSFIRSHVFVGSDMARDHCEETEQGISQMVHGLSFDIEEHFQVAAFDSLARRRHWDKQESRVERNTHVLLEILAERGKTATMFVLGWIAERNKTLVRHIVDAGHEVASHGYAHELISMQSPQTFREDISRTKKLLEDITGKPVFGYRAPSFSLMKETEWALPIIREEGYRYDSSIIPNDLNIYETSSNRPCIHQIPTSAGPLWEIPVTTYKFGGFKIPIAAGESFRIVPYSIFRSLLRDIESQGQPLIIYLRPWELDPEQPRMRGAFLSRFRHYLNLHKVQYRLTQLLKDFSFGPMHNLLAQ